MNEQSSAANPTLHVVFAGLCMLVRDETEKQLHVLLPSDHKHARHDGGPVKHEACLVHDVAYGATGTVTDQMSRIDLNGVVLDMRAIGGEKPPPSLKVEGVVDEECMRGTPVKREYLTAVPPEKLIKSRISIASGRAGRNVPGALWQLGDCLEQTMAVSAEWLIHPKVNAGTVDIPVHRKGVASTLKLTPPADGHIYLFILHIPEGTLTELPTFPYEPSGVPTDDPEAKHFRAFYPLIGRSEDVKGPIYKGIPSNPTGQTGSDQSNKGRKAIAGFDYGCMLSTARAAL
jgi:hypothetical protein